jgi:hypothetical protein
MAYFKVLFYHSPKETKGNHEHVRRAGNVEKIQTGYLPKKITYI